MDESEIAERATARSVGTELQARALRHLTPELIKIFKLSSEIADDASQRYDAAVGGIRGDARQLRALREFYESLPVAAYLPRQAVVNLVGFIGTNDEVAMLEDVARAELPPVASVAPETSGEHSHHTSPVDQQSQLRNGAVGSLSLIAQRGEVAALESLVRLLTEGDRLIATLAAVELAGMGKLGASERKALVARGITGSFAKLDFEKTFKIDPAGLAGNPRSKPLVEPPTAP